jgi:preprotein translocase subunit SecG
MENVVLIIHLLLALGIIAVVLLQRSEGGGLGMGGGGGGGAGASRPALSPLGKVTWGFAIAFIATSLTLTILAAQRSAGTSILDRIGTTPPTDSAPATPPAADDLLPPAAGDAPLTPPRAD